MVGNPVEQVKVTSDDLVNQLIKHVAGLVLDNSALKAENEKLKKMLTDSLAQLKQN